MLTRGGGTRRSNSCWTCKLRRKKCDEAKPSCVSCESRNLTCHGYGDIPQWMDGGTAEKAELSRIKDGVKENKRRKRKSQARVRLMTVEADTIPTSSMIEDEDYQVYPDMQDQCCEPERSSSALHQQSQISTPLGPSQYASIIVTPITEPSHFQFGYHREAELLMHYLDYVFALQFRFHKPSVHNGGRGWLLWLLTETKPLYHAALSLGALHQHSLLDRNIRGQRYHDTLNELNEHHNRALQELQIFLQSNYDDSTAADLGRKRRLQILACGVELISFEVCSLTVLVCHGADTGNSFSAAAPTSGKFISMLSPSSFLVCKSRTRPSQTIHTTAPVIPHPLHNCPKIVSIPAYMTSGIQPRNSSLEPLYGSISSLVHRPGKRHVLQTCTKSF